MARSRLCRVCKDFHSFEAAWPAECLSHFGVPASDAPYVRTDGMDPLKSMADGKTYDSKSAYYGSVRRAGCEIVGDDRAGFGPKPEWKLPPVGPDIKRAIERLS
jgi:hypothetical protein